MQQIIIPIISAFIGYAIAYLIGKNRHEEIEIGNQLMAAINDARKDVLAAYKMIDEMEAVNIRLRQENYQLKSDNQVLFDTTDSLRKQLNKALEEIERLARLTANYINQDGEGRPQSK